MRNFPVLFLYLALLPAFGCVSTPNARFDTAEMQQINRIAVMDFSDAPKAEAASSGVVVAAALVNELLATKGITVVERSKLHSLLEEQKLSMIGLVDEKTAVEAGKILGVNMIVLGSVSEYDTSSIPIFLGLVTYYMDLYNVAGTMRIINVETGKVVFSGECSAKSKVSYQDAAIDVAKALVKRIQESRGDFQ